MCCSVRFLASEAFFYSQIEMMNWVSLKGHQINKENSIHNLVTVNSGISLLSPHLKQFIQEKMVYIVYTVFVLSFFTKKKHVHPGGRRGKTTLIISLTSAVFETRVDSTNWVSIEALPALALPWPPWHWQPSERLEVPAPLAFKRLQGTSWWRMRVTRTLKLTAKVPLKIGQIPGPKRKRVIIPTIHFQERNVSFRECNF